MFSIVRIIFWGILLVIPCYFIRRSNITNKKRCIVVLLIAYAIISSLSGLIPVENIFITFKSPKQAYNYKHFDKLELVLDGNETSFAIGKTNNTTFNISIIPKKIMVGN